MPLTSASAVMAVMNPRRSRDYARPALVSHASGRIGRVVLDSLLPARQARYRAGSQINKSQPSPQALHGSNDPALTLALTNRCDTVPHLGVLVRSVRPARSAAGAREAGPVHATRSPEMTSAALFRVA